MRLLRGLASLSLALAALGCGAVRTPGALDPAALEREFRAQTRTVVLDEALDLRSPYGEDATAPYLEVVRTEARLVRELLDVPSAPPIRFTLAALDGTGAELPPWVRAGRDGVAGAHWSARRDGSDSQGFAFVYVPADESQARMRATLAHTLIRHELVHAYADRNGLDGPTWFAEALANEIEGMSVRGDRLATQVFPSELIRARDSAGPGSVARLLDWRHTDDITAAERARRYAEAQALLRFLLERAPGTGLVERARAVRALQPEAVAACEPEWLDWLAGLDALAAVRSAVRTGSAEERVEAAHALGDLLSAGAAELASREADELALELLADPAASQKAFVFLCFFRARALTEADLAGLGSASDPALRLTAHALRAKRSESVDLADARAALARLSEDERASVLLQTRMIPGLAGD